MSRKLTKFPAIAADGTEYRVTIDEWPGGWASDYAEARLYVRRKRLGFRKVYVTTYDDGGAVYNASSPDFILIARQVCEDYRLRFHELRVAAVESRTQAKRKSAAIDAFQAWDGRL